METWLFAFVPHPEPLSSVVQVDCHCPTQRGGVHRNSSVNIVSWTLAVHNLPDGAWWSTRLSLRVWYPTQAVMVFQGLLNGSPLPDRASQTDFLIPIVS